MSFQARPISFKPPRLNGLSARLIASHYENNYGGAVRRLNAIAAELAASDPATLAGFRLNGLKREELIATNSMMLHEVYFDGLGEGGGGEPDGALADAINSAFGSFSDFQAKFKETGVNQFGSGWAWLIHDGSGLAVVGTPNQDNPISEGKTPLLGVDVWEHAYYLKYQNKRPDYLDAWWNTVNWAKVSEGFSAVS